MSHTHHPLLHHFRTFFLNILTNIFIYVFFLALAYIAAIQAAEMWAFLTSTVGGLDAKAS